MDAIETAVEPGELIAEGDCPCCGAELRVEHGDDPDEIAFIGQETETIGGREHLAVELLKEWRSTPFFETREEWERWVRKFGARVDEVLQ